MTIFEPDALAGLKPEGVESGDEERGREGDVLWVDCRFAKTGFLSFPWKWTADPWKRPTTPSQYPYQNHTKNTDE